MGRVSGGANVSGTAILASMRTFVRSIGRSLVRGRRGMCLHNFNDFVLGGETGGATHGVSGGAAVVVSRRGVPTFGPTGIFISTVGGWTITV